MQDRSGLRPDDAEDDRADNDTGQKPEQPMAKTPSPKPGADTSNPAQQQGQTPKPEGQMTGTADPALQQDQPIFRDWAAI